MAKYGIRIRYYTAPDFIRIVEAKNVFEAIGKVEEMLKELPDYAELYAMRDVMDISSKMMGDNNG